MNILNRHSSCGRSQPTAAPQVVGGTHEVRMQLDVGEAARSRADALAAQELDERVAVITLVIPEAGGLAALAALSLQQFCRSRRLRLDRRAHTNIEAQPVAVLHEGMAAKAQLDLFPLTLTDRLRLRIRRGIRSGVEFVVIYFDTVRSIKDQVVCLA